LLHAVRDRPCSAVIVRAEDEPAPESAADDPHGGKANAASGNWKLFGSRCKHLQADNRCGIYERRPRICRKYSTENCDYHGGDYDWDLLFSSADQLQRYAREKLKRRRSQKSEVRSQKKRQKRRPPRLRLMPMLGAPHNGSNGNGKHNGHGRFALSLPVLRG
jgi:Fe-S-cluster containining protein